MILLLGLGRRGGMRELWRNEVQCAKGAITELTGASNQEKSWVFRRVCHIVTCNLSLSSVISRQSTL